MGSLKEWLAAGCLGLLAPSAVAQAPSPLAELNRLEGSLPANIQALVTVRHARAVRRTPAVEALRHLLSESGRLAETERAWRSLAATLNWTPEQAFDELLGRHVTFVAGGLNPGAEGWALVGGVSRATEERMRLALRPAPRAVVRGLTVLAVEDGAFELTIRNRPVGEVLAGDDGAGEGSTFMLAPAGSGHLLEEIIPLLGAGERDGNGSRLMASSGRPTAFALVRSPLADGAGAARFLAMTAAVEPGSEGFHVRLMLGRAGGPRLDPPQWSLDLLRGLEDGALLATIEVAGVSPLHAAGELLGVPFLYSPAAALEPLPGRRVALVVREHDAASRLPPGESAGSVMTRGGVTRPPAAPGRKPLTVALAVEVSDLQGSIPTTDALAAGLAPIASNPAPSDPVPVVIDALDEREVRHLPLEGAGAEPWHAVVGAEPVLRWGYTRTGVGPADRGLDPGWWVIGLEPGDARSAARAVEEARDVLGREPATGRMLPRVSAGLIRPRQVERWLSGMDPSAMGDLRPLRWIEEARWDTWVATDGAIEGEITIRMRAP